MTTLAAALSPVAILNAISGSGASAETRDVRLWHGPAGTASTSTRRRLVATNRPVIVFFYGGGWEEGDRAMYRFVGTALASRGIVVAIPDYRVYPEVRFPGFRRGWRAGGALGPRQHRRTTAAIRRASSSPGHSAGAHIAAMLAIDGRWLRAEGMDNRVALRPRRTLGSLRFPAAPLGDAEDHLRTGGGAPALPADQLRRARTAAVAADCRLRRSRRRSGEHNAARHTSCARPGNRSMHITIRASATPGDRGALPGRSVASRRCCARSRSSCDRVTATEPVGEAVPHDRRSGCSSASRSSSRSRWRPRGR